VNSPNRVVVAAQMCMPFQVGEWLLVSSPSNVESQALARGAASRTVEG
jgi:hypothetical protein